MPNHWLGQIAKIAGGTKLPTLRRRHLRSSDRQLAKPAPWVLGLLVLVALLWVFGEGHLSGAEPDQTKKPSTFPNPVKRKLEKQEAEPADGKIQLMVALELPPGWKWNGEAPIVYYVDAEGDQGPIDRGQIRRQRKISGSSKIPGSAKISGSKVKFPIPLRVAKGGEEVQRIEAMEVTLNYIICQESGEGEGQCRAGSVIWTFPLHVKEGAKRHQVPLTVKLPAS